MDSAWWLWEGKEIEQLVGSLTIEGFENRLVTRESGEVVHQFDAEQPMIRFTTLPLGPERTEVQVWWRPELGPAIDWVLEAIAERWPESGLCSKEPKPAKLVGDREETAKPEVEPPKGSVTRARWSKVYDLIKPQVLQGHTVAQIHRWLVDVHGAHPKAGTGIEEDLSYSERTLRDILKWGDSGKPNSQ
jgi:hypothetical protein